MNRNEWDRKAGALTLCTSLPQLTGIDRPSQYCMRHKGMSRESKATFLRTHGGSVAEAGKEVRAKRSQRHDHVSKSQSWRRAWHAGKLPPTVLTNLHQSYPVQGNGANAISSVTGLQASATETSQSCPRERERASPEKQQFSPKGCRP